MREGGLSHARLPWARWIGSSPVALSRRDGEWRHEWSAVDRGWSMCAGSLPLGRRRGTLMSKRIRTT
jgi:hypothetical protein